MDLRLVPMTDEEFLFWSTRSLSNYRDDKIKANSYTFDEAEKIAQESFKKLLPEGKSSPDQYLFTIRNGSEICGYLWYAMIGASDNRKAFLYDIIIEESVRGKGIGRMAMRLLEAQALHTGAKSICLHVFGGNERAIRLYQSLGYGITDLSMEKGLI